MPALKTAAIPTEIASAAHAVLGVSSIVSGESPTYSTQLGKMPDTPGRKPLAENLTTMEGLDEASNPLPQKDPLSYARVLKNPSPPGSPSTRPHSPIPSKLDSTLGRVESLLESLSKKLDSMDTRVKQLEFKGSKSKPIVVFQDSSYEPSTEAASQTSSGTNTEEDTDDGSESNNASLEKQTPVPTDSLASSLQALRELLKNPAKPNNIMTVNAIKPYELKAPLTYSHIGMWYNRAKQIDEDASTKVLHGRFLNEDVVVIIQKSRRERLHDQFLESNPKAVFNPSSTKITRLDIALAVI